MEFRRVLFRSNMKIPCTGPIAGNSDVCGSTTKGLHACNEIERELCQRGTNENLYSEVVSLEQCEVLGLYILIVDQDVVGLHEGGLIQSALFVQKPLRIQRRHAAEAGRGDRLPVVLVGDITGGEHALDRSLRGAAAEPGADLQVTVVHRQLALEQAGVGRMSDGHEDTVHVDLGGTVVAQRLSAHTSTTGH